MNDNRVAFLIGAVILIAVVGGYFGFVYPGWTPQAGTGAATVPATASLKPITPIAVTTSLAFNAEKDDTEPASVSAPSTAVPAEPTESSGGPQVHVSPAAAAPGSVVTISGQGFGASEVVSISIDGQGTSPIELLSGSDDAGAFEAAYQIPADAPLGTYTVEVRGNESGETARARLLAAEGPTPTPIVIRIETALATTTPQAPAAEATPRPLYQVVDTRAGVDCGWYGFFGTVSDPDGNPRDGVSIRVYHEGDEQVVTGRAETDADGYWEVSLGDSPESELAGLWHLVVMEEDQRGSSEIAVDLATRCDAGRPTKFQVNWQRSIQ